MKRINVIPIIITLCLALACFAATIALLFIPEPKSLKITEKPTVEYVDGEYVVHGKIKNVSGKEIILRAYGFRAEVSAINESGNNMTYTIKPYDDIAVQPDEEIALSFLHAKLGTLQNAKINKIIFTPEHTDITVYGNVINNGNFAICALFTGIAGAGLLIISIASSVTANRNAKRVNHIIAQMRQSFENAAYCGGYYGSKSQNRTCVEIKLSTTPAKSAGKRSGLIGAIKPFARRLASEYRLNPLRNLSAVFGFLSLKRIMQSVCLGHSL